MSRDVSRARHLRAGGGAPGRRRAAVAHGQDHPGLSAARSSKSRSAPASGPGPGASCSIDRFGNIVTNFHADEFPDLERRDFSLAFGPHEVERTGAQLRRVRRRASCSPIVGSSGYLEVSVNQGSAAKQIGCESGAVVEMAVG